MKLIKINLFRLLGLTFLLFAMPVYPGSWVNNKTYEFSIYFPGNQPVKESKTNEQTTYSQVSRDGKVTQHYDSVSITRGSLYEIIALVKPGNFTDYINNKLEYDTGDFIDIQGHLAFQYQLTRKKRDFENEHTKGLLIELPKGIIHLRTIEYQEIPQAGIQYYSDSPYTDYFFESLHLQ